MQDSTTLYENKDDIIQIIEVVTPRELLPLNFILDSILQDYCGNRADTIFNDLISTMNKITSKLPGESDEPSMHDLFRMGYITAGDTASISLQSHLDNVFLLIRPDNSLASINTINDIPETDLICVCLACPEDYYQYTHREGRNEVNATHDWPTSVRNIIYKQLSDVYGNKPEWTMRPIHFLVIRGATVFSYIELFFYPPAIILKLIKMYDTQIAEDVFQIYSPLYNQLEKIKRDQGLIPNQLNLQTKEGIIDLFRRTCNKLSWTNPRSITFDMIASKIGIPPSTLLDRLKLHNLAYRSTGCVLIVSSAGRNIEYPCLSKVNMD